MVMDILVRWIYWCRDRRIADFSLNLRRRIVHLRLIRNPVILIFRNYRVTRDVPFQSLRRMCGFYSYPVHFVREIEDSIGLSVTATHLVQHEASDAAAFTDQILQRNLNFSDEFVSEYKTVVPEFKM